MFLSIKAVLDFISPRVCAMCGHRLSVVEDRMCTVCSWKLPRTYFSQMPYDNRMSIYLMGQFPLERTAGWFFYRRGSAVTKLIFDAKYNGDRALCRWLGSAAAKEMAEDDFFKDIDVIVPLPLTWRRKLERGYNQCFEIARGVSAVTGLPIVDNAVQRTRFNKSQTRVSGEQRRENVNDSFALTRPELLRGKHILLIDDIFTTGATISSCGREVAKAGDVRLSVMTIGVDI